MDFTRIVDKAVAEQSAEAEYRGLALDFVDRIKGEIKTANEGLEGTGVEVVIAEVVIEPAPLSFHYLSIRFSLQIKHLGSFYHQPVTSYVVNLNYSHSQVGWILYGAVYPNIDDAISLVLRFIQRDITQPLEVAIKKSLTKTS